MWLLRLEGLLVCPQAGIGRCWGHLRSPAAKPHHLLGSNDGICQSGGLLQQSLCTFHLGLVWLDIAAALNEPSQVGETIPGRYI